VSKVFEYWGEYYNALVFIQNIIVAVFLLKFTNINRV